MSSSYPVARLAAQQLFRGHGRQRPDATAEQIIRGLIQQLKTHDPHTAGHAERVARLAVRITGELGLPAAEVELIGQAALLHDIGKLALAAAMLDRREPRGPLDAARVRRHAIIGARLLIALGLGPQLAELVRAHHERYDGAGYPDGLAGDAIPLGARVIAVADVYDSLTRPRPGITPLPATAAAAALLADGGRRLDPRLVAALLDSLCLRG